MKEKATYIVFKDHINKEHTLMVTSWKNLLKHIEKALDYEYHKNNDELNGVTLSFKIITKTQE